MKKLLSLVLVLALLVSAVAVLSSCGECEHEWTYTADGSVYHKQTCKLCGTVQKSAHKFTTGSEENEGGMIENTCRLCNLVVESYPWEDEKELSMWIADNSNNNELLCGSLAFIAGETDEEKYTDQSLMISDSNLLDKVIARNNSAEVATKTDIKYIYSSDYAWGKQMGAINTLIKSGASDTPDMYVGFVYDMVGVELNKNLRNLNDSKYFAFNSEDYDPSVDEEGYFWDYMNSLSFSVKGRFLVSSNYMVDTVRAYFVTPVSIKLLKKSGITTDEFLTKVNENKYTWSMIADMTTGKNGYTPVAVQGQNGWDFLQTNTGAIWGFALASTCKLAIAGLTYANDFTIIDREYDETKGDYKYTLNADPTAYANLAASLKTTIGETDGIVNARTHNNPAGTVAYDGQSTDMVSIQKAFAEQRLLVGGVIVLGAIEDSSYRSMWDEDQGYEGYIVTPMPLYKEGDQYRTVIHNLAKVIGIQKGTGEFIRCSAYIDYCSRNSEDVLNDYYNWSLAMGTAGAFAQNVTLIQKMRARLVYTISKVADDAINLALGNGTIGGEAIVWKNYTYHNILLNNYTEGTGISTRYTQVVDAKQAAVEELQTRFIAACDPVAQ